MNKGKYFLGYESLGSHTYGLKILDSFKEFQKENRIISLFFEKKKWKRYP